MQGKSKRENVINSPNQINFSGKKNYFVQVEPIGALEAYPRWKMTGFKMRLVVLVDILVS